MSMPSLLEHSIRRQSLSTGLSYTADLVRTFNPRTKPLLSGKVSTTLPSGQELRCKVSPMTKTTSPTAKFLWGCTHFCLSCRRGRHTLLHLLQKISVRYCTCFHRRRESKSSFLNRPGGEIISDLSNNRWLGVKGSMSLGSLDTVMMGRLFMMLSTSHLRVTKLPSSAICSHSKACRIFQMVRIHLSQMSPK